MPPVGRDEPTEGPSRREQDAVDDVARRNWLFVHRIVTSSVRQPWEAEELTQEVFVRALPHLTGHFDGDRTRAYLAQTARNLLRDRWRRRQHMIIEPGVPDGPGDAPDPQTSVIDLDDRSDLVAALGRLPAEQQAVLRLRLLEGLSAAEVADRLGRNPDNVRQLQHRALLRLREDFLAAGGRSADNGGRP
ncbi:MAG TPA: sigma-70 family RNA polymerase sigma factor [Acidimicrobiales bacterium]|nr:sigma-70 family RNA polymerase sigma factor [Acidimicrobiales bacterium]